MSYGSSLPAVQCLLLAALLLLTSCGGQSAQPNKADTSAQSPPQPGDATPSAESFDPSALQGGDPVPPMFDPAVAGQTDAAEPAATVPGPLAAGLLEAEARAKVVLVENGQPMEVATDWPVRIRVEAVPSDRGHEIRASLATPEPKSEGGFLFFSGSTGGGPDIPPAPGSNVRAGTDEKGHWHYGIMETPTPVGLLNVADIAGRSGKLYPPDATIPESTHVDMFEAVIDTAGICTLTAAGTLPDQRRLVITATSTGPVQATQATPADAAPAPAS